jgi:hypothetical protein
MVAQLETRQTVNESYPLQPPRPQADDYSARNATAGSTRIARSAGT